MYFQQADFFSLLVQIINGFFYRAGSRPHQDHHASRVRGAHIIEQVVVASGLDGEAIHHILHNGRTRQIVGVARLPRLEKYIRILCRAAQNWTVRTEGALAMSGNIFLFQQCQDGLVRDCLGLVDFVRGAKSVKEVEERDARLQRGQVGDQRHIAGLLHRIGRQHGIAGGAAGHHIRVVAKNRERMGRDGARRYMNHIRRQFARNFVHVGDHQQQPLRRRKCGAERACLQRSVHGARSSAFTLQFGDDGDRAPDVTAPFFLPLIGPLAHGGRGCNRINGDDFRQAISDRCRGFVSIQNDCFFFSHCLPFVHPHLATTKGAPDVRFITSHLYNQGVAST